MQSNRLVYFISKESGLVINNYMRLKPHVYIIETTTGLKVLKGYTSYRKMAQIYEILRKLNQVGFEQAINYEIYPNKKLTCLFQGMHWSIMPYIRPKNNVNYYCFQDREETILLLKKLHAYGKSVAMECKNESLQLNLIEKWLNRMHNFKKNTNALQLFLSKSIINLLVCWAESSLANFQVFSSQPLSSPTIIHGDVASHNVIRTLDNELCLIDFDLLAIAPEEYEYVQVIQRFMRCTNWSLSLLKKHPFISKLLSEKSLTVLLLYPADLLREWNRLIAQNFQCSNPRNIGNLIKRTEEEVYFRYRLHREICHFISS